MPSFDKDFDSLQHFTKFVTGWKNSTKPLILIQSKDKMFLALDLDPKSGAFCVLQLFPDKNQCRIFVLVDKKAQTVKTYKNPVKFRAALPLTKWVASQRNQNTYFQNNQTFYDVAVTYTQTEKASQKTAQTPISKPSTTPKSSITKRVDEVLKRKIPNTTTIKFIQAPHPQYLQKLNELCKGQGDQELRMMEALIHEKLSEIWKR